jgi:hypothetical protein
MFISDPDPKFDTKEDNAIIALLVKIGLLTPQILILRSSEGLKGTRFGRKELIKGHQLRALPAQSQKKWLKKRLNQERDSDAG